MVLEKSSLQVRSNSPVAAVCSGSSCRGENRAKLCAILEEVGYEVRPVKCLGVCDGPVAVVTVAGETRVIADIRKKEHRAKVVQALMSAKPKRLRRFTVKGSTARRAQRRAEKALRDR